MDERAGTEPRWLDEREARAWRGYTRMRIELEAALSRRLAQRSGLSHADYAVLVELSEADDGRLRAFQLGRALRWEKSRLSHHLKRMEARGHICREECAEDARGSEVVLTPAGRRAIETAAPAHVEDVRRLLIDRLSTEQLDTLAEIAGVVVTALDAEEPEGCG
ncbi:MAG: MarR family winged helix-turn-helix transcriptional regulator [Nitriliruptoraceae bacterium]